MPEQRKPHPFAFIDYNLKRYIEAVNFDSELNCRIEMGGGIGFKDLKRLKPE